MVRNSILFWPLISVCHGKQFSATSKWSNESKPLLGSYSNQVLHGQSELVISKIFFDDTFRGRAT